MDDLDLNWLVPYPLLLFKKKAIIKDLLKPPPMDEYHYVWICCNIPIQIKLEIKKLKDKVKAATKDSKLSC